MAHRRAQVLQHLDAVRVTPVVHDPPEQVDVRGAFQRLLGEEVVGHEFDPSLKLHGKRRAALLDGAGEILDDECDVPSRLSQELGDAAVVAAHVHHRGAGAVDGRPVEARDEMLQVPALAFGEETHTRAEAPRALRVLAEELVHGQGGFVRHAEGRLVGLTRVAVAFQGFDDSACRRRELRCFQSDSVEESGVCDHHPRGCCMADGVGRYFCEDVVSHCVAHETPDQRLGQAAFRRNVLVCGGTLDWDGLRELELIDHS